MAPYISRIVMRNEQNAMANATELSAEITKKTRFDIKERLASIVWSRTFATHLIVVLFHMFQNTSLHTALDAVTSELELPHPQYGSTKQQNTKIISANIHLKPQYTNHFYICHLWFFIFKLHEWKCKYSVWLQSVQWTKCWIQHDLWVILLCMNIVISDDWASLWVPAVIDFVRLFTSNRRFFNKIVACILKIVLPRSVTLWKWHKWL